MEEKQIFLSVQLDTKDLLKTAEESSKKLTELKDRQKELKDSGQQNSVEYAKLKEEIKQYTKSLNDSASALVINEKLQGKSNLTGIEQAQLQKSLAVAYNNLTDEQKKNTVAGQNIAKAYKEVNEALNESSLSVSNGKRNVGLYEQSIKKAYAEIGKLEKQVNQIGFAYGQNTERLDENKKALDKLAQSGDTTSAEYKSLQKEVEYYTEAVDMNKKSLDLSNQELIDQKESLAQVEQEARKVGFVYGENANQTENLKKQLKDLKAELSTLDPNSEAFIEGSQKAGELADKIKDVNEAVKAQASGSQFEKLGNTFGLLKDDLANLDFEGVAEKAKQFQAVASGLTLKEMIGGLKNAGSALLSLAKTILANPLFLMAAVIAAVSYAIYTLTSSTEDLTAKSESLTRSYEQQVFVLDLLAERTNRINDFNLKMAEIQGKSADEILKIKLKQNDDEEKADLDRIENLRIHLGEINDLSKKAYEQGDVDLAKKLMDERTKTQQQYQTLIVQQEKYTQNARLILEEYDAEQLEKQREASRKAAEESKRRNEKAIEDAKNARLKIRDLLIEQDQLDANAQLEALNAELEFTKKAIELTVENELDKNKQLLEVEENYLKEYIQILDQKIEAEKSALEASAEDEINSLKGSKEQIAEQRRLIEENLQIQLDQIDKTAKDELAKREQEFQEKRIELTRLTNSELIKLNEERISNYENDLNEQTLLLEQNGKTELEILQATYKKQVELAEARNKAIQEDETKTDQEKKAAQIELNRTIYELNKNAVDQEKELNAEKLDNAKAISSQISGITSELVGKFGQIREQQTEQILQSLQANFQSQNESLEAQLNSQVISLEKYNQEKEKLEKQFNAKSREIRLQQFEREKKANLVEAGINTAVAVTEALPNLLLAGIAGTLGALQIGFIAGQTPGFASGGLTGQLINSNDGVSISRPNGDNLLATVKTGEIITNQSQQRYIESVAGSDIWARAGVKGFASGGLTGVNSVSSSGATRSVDTFYQQRTLIESVINNMKTPVVDVVQIIDKTNEYATTVQDANI
jgi:hypothetical protein